MKTGGHFEFVILKYPIKEDNKGFVYFHKGKCSNVMNYGADIWYLLVTVSENHSLEYRGEVKQWFNTDYLIVYLVAETAFMQRK